MRINDFVPGSKIFEKNPNNNEVNIEGTKDLSFGNYLKGQLDEVNDKQIAADKATDSFIKGESVDIHKLMIDSEEAKLSLELAVQMRNKLVEAYQELNRMQL